MNWWKRWQERWARGWVSAIVGSAWIRRLIWGFCFAALLTLILSYPAVPERVAVVEGEPAPRDISSPRDIVNRVATRNRAEAAAGRVEDIYAIEPVVADAAISDLIKVMGRVQAVRADATATDEEKLERLSELFPGANEAVLQAVLRASGTQIDVVESEATARLRQELGKEIYPRDVDEVRTQLDAWVPQNITDKNLQLLVREQTKQRIQANMVLDRLATEQARSHTRELVEQNPVLVKRGQRIVSQGELVTEEQYELLRDLGMVGPNTDARVVAGVGLYALLAVALMTLYLWRFRRDLLERDSRILMVGVVTLLTVIIALLVQPFSGYLMPVALGTMLVTILLDTRVALVVGVVLTFLVGVVAAGDLNATLVAAVGAYTGALSLQRVEQRSDLIRAGLLVALANVAVILALYLMSARSLTDLNVWMDAGYGALNGLTSAMLAIGTLPFMESIFGVLTPMKLLELANPNHPLLRRLMVEAPGTYHHTIMVANLCESAAEAVGADPMLARVGAFYHDIGKAKRPYFFAENQFGGENPHDKLPPHLSALIIASHVKDGVEMARERRLPEEIISFIREHHGDTLISYFYHKATENGKSEYILEEDFRYEGPRPRRKETAICMLADGCESSVRALRARGPLNPDQIETQVRTIIQRRLQEGQLDRTDLTLRDLDTLAGIFVRILSGMHHTRIEYPGFQQEAEPQRGDRDPEPATESARAPGPGGPATAGYPARPATGSSPPG